MKEEMKSMTDNKKRSDTLDYYNDSLPKKAVESLFDKDDRTFDDSDSFVRGYDSDDVFGDDFYDDYETEVEVKVETEDKRDKEKHIFIREKPDYREKTMHIPDSDESLEEHLALYSKSGSKRVKRDMYGSGDRYDREDAPRRPSVDETGERIRVDDETGRRPRTIDDTGRRPRTIDDTGRRPRTTDETGRRPRTDDETGRRPRIDDDAGKRVRTDDEARLRADDNAKRRAEHSNSVKTRTLSVRDADENDDDDDGYDSSMPVKNVAIAVAAVVILGLFTFLIVKINTLNASNEEAKTVIESFGDTEKALQQALIDNESLESKITMLEDVIEQYRAALPQSIETGTTAATQENGSENSEANNGSAPPQSGSTSSVTTYTVVSGDNLSKISTKFYGTAKEYKKIIDANSLTTESIYVGQVLIIP